MAYMFKNVHLLIATIEIQGFWQGDDVVTLDPKKETYGIIEGADGSEAHYIVNTKLCDLTFKLQQHAPSNATLSQLLITARETGIGMPFPVTVVDMGTGDKAFSLAAGIIKPAKLIKGEKANGTEWTITGRFDFLYGGQGN